MIRNKHVIVTDLQGKEIKDAGLELFDLTSNEGDINAFITGNIPAHWHKELELFILLEGHIQIGIKDKLYELKAGNGCFINSEVLHSFQGLVSSPCTYRSFVFDANIVGGAPGSIFDTEYVRPLIENGCAFLKLEDHLKAREFFQQFDTAFTACTEEYYGYEFDVRAALSKLMLYLRENTPIDNFKKLSLQQEACLKQILKWIDDNLGSPITVTDIADIGNISPRECQRLFQRYLHLSPIKYLQHKRILAATKLLSATDDSIINIAIECGFSSPSYFSKQFKLLVGMTPKEYRNGVIT